MFWRTPTAGLIFLHPGIQINPVECPALLADGNLKDIGAHLPIESIAIHAQIIRGIAQANQSRQYWATSFSLTVHKVNPA